jgi:hypothetical protein
MSFAIHLGSWNCLSGSQRCASRSVNKASDLKLTSKRWARCYLLWAPERSGAKPTRSGAEKHGFIHCAYRNQPSGYCHVPNELEKAPIASCKQLVCSYGGGIDLHCSGFSEFLVVSFAHCVSLSQRQVLEETANLGQSATKASPRPIPTKAPMQFANQSNGSPMPMRVYS